MTFSSLANRYAEPIGRVRPGVDQSPQHVEAKMGLCTPFTKCAICADPIGEGREVLGFPTLVPVFSEFGDFYDGCVHQECIESWPRKHVFISYFNSLVEESSPPILWHLVELPSGRVSFAKGVCKP